MSYLSPTTILSGTESVCVCARVRARAIICTAQEASGSTSSYLTFQADAGALQRLQLSREYPCELGQFHFAPNAYRRRRGDRLAPAIAVPRRHSELVLCSRFQVECVESVGGTDAHLSGTEPNNTIYNLTAAVLASGDGTGRLHRRVQRPGREADHLPLLMPKLRMNGAILPRRCMRSRRGQFIIRL